jgi:hypothetical protein
LLYSQPAFFPRAGGNSVFVPGDVIVALVERRQTIQRFEFKRLLDRQADQDAPLL